VTVGQVAIFTPVADDRAEGLSRLLSELPRDQPPTAQGPGVTPPSPFTGVLPPTHFARFVVIRLDGDRPYLLFTSVFDGDTRDYLRALARTGEGQRIWSHCQLDGAAAPLSAEGLEPYLCDEGNWRPTQYAVSALADGVTVGQVNRALSLRVQLAGLVTRAAGLDPTALAHDFRQLPAVQALLARR
jgi:hypothetical protein